jgi:hypothetical protein
MDWRLNATKMVVLIADAPPHGIGEHGDGFPQGSPCGSLDHHLLFLLANPPLGRDPLQIARTMASRGIVLVSVGSSDLGPVC